MEPFHHTLLTIDLKDHCYYIERISGEILREYLGGASLASKLLFPYLVNSLNPFSPEAPLLFITGPLTGTTGPSVGRYVVCARSPATGLWGESNVGGFFGPEMRKAGVDGILIKGKSPIPIYLWINDGSVEFRTADHLWGQADTYVTQEKIKEELAEPRAHVACIGRAGEQQIPFAAIICDHGRAAGRTGMGAVMGSKNLKAIAVRGTHNLQYANPEGFKSLRRKVNANMGNENIARAFRQYGTASVVDYFEYVGDMPKYAFSKGVFPEAEKISGVTMAESILSGVSACHGCVIACGRVVCLEDGENRKGPEYETIAGFGPNLGNSDLGKIALLGELCDRYGLDVISISNTIGLAFLLYERGEITERDTEGLKLRWGDMDVVEAIIHKTVDRDGIGEWIARGARGLAHHFGVPECASEVKGLEVPYHDPRACSGMVLVYATSPIGASHNHSDYFRVDILGDADEQLGMKRFERQAGAVKAANVARHQDWRSVCNALVQCYFANVPFDDILELVNLVTGFSYTGEELLQVGERSWNLKRLINHRLGQLREDDRLPGILMKGLPEGGAAGYVPPLDEMLVEYYRIRGWDSETGKPLPEKLQELNLLECL